MAVRFRRRHELWKSIRCGRDRNSDPAGYDSGLFILQSQRIRLGLSKGDVSMKKAQHTGVIREYDLHALSVKTGYVFIIVLCLLMVIVAVFPLLWVSLAGFKDLKEFLSSTSIFPQSFNPKPFITTWSQLGIAKNYLNSMISVVGCVLCAFCHDSRRHHLCGRGTV